MTICTARSSDGLHNFNPSLPALNWQEIVAPTLFPARAAIFRGFADKIFVVKREARKATPTQSRVHRSMACAIMFIVYGLVRVYASTYSYRRCVLVLVLAPIPTACRH